MVWLKLRHVKRDATLEFWTVPAALLGLAGIAWWALQPLPPADGGRPTTPSIEARGAHSIIVREGGLKAWEFSAARIAVAPDRVRTALENIADGTIFQAGVPLWRLRARRVEANQFTRDLEVQDIVASLATESLRISTPHAQWKHRAKTLTCTGPMFATMKNIGVTAQAATYDTRSGELRCTRGVAVSSPYGTLKAPAATAFPKDRRVEFHGGVDIVMHLAALMQPHGGAAKAGTPGSGTNGIVTTSNRSPMKSYALFAFVGATAGATAHAQTPPVAKPAVTASGAMNAPPTAPVDGAAKRGDVRIRNAKDGTATSYNKTGVSRITKDVVVTQEGEDFILRAQQIDYNERTNEAIGSGKLRIDSRDSTVTGDALRADFDRKIITISGHVVMNSHGQGNGLRGTHDAKRKPSQITCERLDYNYETRQATITGNISMAQEKNIGTCERILYDEDSNYAQLLGAVIFRNTETGRTMRSTDVQVWMDDDIVKANNRTTVTSPDKRTPRPAGPRTNVPRPEALPSDLGDQFGRPLPPPPPPAPTRDEPDEPATPASAVPAPEKDKK